MKIAISTGGGDAPGLNAVIRGAVLGSVHRGWECLGIRRGYAGLLGEDRVVPLDANAVRDITHLGGTILGTTNRGDPSGGVRPGRVVPRSSATAPTSWSRRSGRSRSTP